MGSSASSERKRMQELLPSELEEMATLGVRPEEVQAFGTLAKRTRLPRTYELGRVLGKGAFGTVWFAKHRKSQQEFAVKRSDSARDPRAMREVEIMHLLGSSSNVPHLCETFVTARNIYIVMDFCPDGDVIDLLQAQDSCTEVEAAHIMHGVLQCLQFANSLSVAHRDIKASNVLLDLSARPAIRVKLTDWGSATYFHDKLQLFTESAGTGQYMAPEVINMLYYPVKADVWSCGVLLFFLLCGDLPYDAPHKDLLFDRVRSKKLVVPPYISTHVSSAGQQMLLQMLSRRPEQRPDPVDLLQHPWLQERGAVADAAASFELPLVDEGSVSLDTHNRFLEQRRRPSFPTLV
eukprot:m.77571 g.77571  ORF g.77571 m.77571 type:complete len:349 (+) comp14707_c0_seq1:297-1343(+)